MKKTFLLIFTMIATTLILSAIAFGQSQTVSVAEIDKNIEMMRKNLRGEKKQIIAMNVPLTPDEATKFWPLYEQYAADMSKNYDEFYSVIKDYAANQKTLTDAQASAMIKRWSAIQVGVAQTRSKYIPMVEKVIPGKKAALFFQIDRRLYALLDLQVASEVPLVLQ
jgi:hypothetical protein